MREHTYEQLSLVCQLILIIEFVQKPTWILGIFLFLIFYDVIKDIILDIYNYITYSLKQTT